MADSEYIELNDFLKIKQFASTGGRAKLLIRSQGVFVNDIVETRNRRKLHAGDRVRVQEKIMVVEESILRPKKEK